MSLSNATTRSGQEARDETNNADAQDSRHKKVQAARAEIARRYDQKKPDREVRLNSIAVKRIRDIERYLWDRYGSRYDGVVPDDAAGREDLVILLNHLAQNPIDPLAKMRASLRYWAPWMDRDERQELVARIAAKPRWYKAKKLGQLLRVTEEEHARLDLKSTWAFTWTEATVKANARQKDREYQKAKRDANRSGRSRGRPKSEGVPAWQAAGASSKAGYYRNRKKAAAGETKNESAYKKILIQRLNFSLTPPGDGLGDFDFKRFGITAIRVMRGTEIVRAWNAPSSHELRAAHTHRG
jgi:hypothetical protein